MFAILFAASLLVLLALLAGPSIRFLSIVIGLEWMLLMATLLFRFTAAHLNMNVDAFGDHDRPVVLLLLSDAFAETLAAVAVFVAAYSVLWNVRCARGTPQAHSGT